MNIETYDLLSMNIDIAVLENLLSIKFRDGKLLNLALTHPSITHEESLSNQESNQRLEFLGDAFIGLVIAHEIYIDLPNVGEGELTELRSSVVRREALARVGNSIGLGEYLRLGQGEEKNGGRLRSSNIAAAVEALIGAVLIDQGMETAWNITITLLRVEIDRVLREGVTKDPKSVLQEITQSNKKGYPHYSIVDEHGPEHQPVFTVDVIIDEVRMGRGIGHRKIDAERAAASEAILKMDVTGTE